MSIKNELMEEFNDEVKGLRGLQLGSDEYKATVDGVTKLADRIIEIEKIEKDAKSKEVERESNDYLKMKQMEDDKKDRWVRNGIAIAGIIVPSVLTVWGTLKSFKCEETGTVTTILGRGFINKLLPKK